jgi:DNA repair protein RadC
MKRPNWYVRDPPPLEDLLVAIVGPKGRALPPVFGSLKELLLASPEDLSEHLSTQMAFRLKAVFKLLSLVAVERVGTMDKICDARGVYNLYHDRFREEKQEHFLAIILDTKHRILREVLVSKGTLNGSIVHPREVFAPAIRERAASILVLHNHPSGDPAPSHEDIEITHRLRETGDLIGIPLLDHVILGADSFISLREQNIIP